MIEPALPIELLGIEIVFLMDKLRNGDNGKTVEEELSCLRPLILIMGSAYREVVTPQGIDAVKPVTLHVTKDMAWLLRSKVMTGDIGCDGKTVIGVNLNLKLFELLENFESGMSDMATVDADEELLSEETKKWLKEGFDARPLNHSSPDAS